jgi:DNA-binding NarL/FixJ family response regulator
MPAPGCRRPDLGEYGATQLHHGTRLGSAFLASAELEWKQSATPREEPVDALVAEGLGNRNIAPKLNLSEHTIKKYLFRIFEKLGISSGVELVLYAVNNGDPRQAEWLAGAGRVVPSA